MNKLTRILGSMLISLLLVFIPMLTLASVVDKWYGFIQLILCNATLMETAAIATFIYERSEDEQT